MSRHPGARLRAALIIAASTLACLAPAVADGYTNGRLPSSALAPIHSSGASAVLSRPAAGAMNTLRLCSLRTGVDLTTSGDGAYRTLSLQNYRWSLYQHGGNLAAYPGTSNHGWGESDDLDQPQMRTWLDAHGSPLGWRKTEAPTEWWHINYTGGFGRPDPGTSAVFPVLRRGSGGACQQPYVDELRRRLGAARGRPFTAGLASQLRRWQLDHHLHRTSTTNQATWTALRTASRAIPKGAQPRVTPTRRPVAGPDVTAIQGSYNARALEMRLHRIPVSGVFDTTTGRAIRRFQNARKLKVTGTVDQATRRALQTPLKRQAVAPHLLRPAPKVYNAVDISEHNGCAVNFRAVKAAGWGAVILRVGYVGPGNGLYRDACFTPGQVSRARAAKLVVGGYLYSVPRRNHAAQADAAWLWKTGKQAGLFQGLDLKPALDLEESDFGGATNTAWGRAWAYYYRKQGALIYTSPGFSSWTGAINMPLWVAHYTSASRPRLPSFAKGWQLWQYSPAGNVAGVGGQVDVNRAPRGGAQHVLLPVTPSDR